MLVARLCAVSLAVLLPSLAQAHGGSMDDQIACTPDVYRLCSAQIPNEDAIVACLQRNKAALTPACQQVFSRPQGAASHNDDE